MKSLHCVIGGKYRKFEKRKISYLNNRKNISSFYYLQ